MFFGTDTLGVKKSLEITGKNYYYFDIQQAAKEIGKDVSKLPFTLKILFENLLRFENQQTITLNDIEACLDWLKQKKSDHEVAFTPARVLMQDFTGVPAVVDLAAMRDAVKRLDGNPEKINPLTPVDLVIDHSVQVDKYGTSTAFAENVKLEMHRNFERYQFLRWGQKAFDNFRVVPPGTGICHQVNLEYLAQVVWVRSDDGKDYIFPDTLVGTDSHTTMINGLGVLGWGVGGIEAEAAMLGKPMTMVLPEVIGFKLTGKTKPGVTATDLVLTITQILRKKGVVNKFVEFYGQGISSLSLADRATIANMAPEYGATCGFFPVDRETINFLELTARDPIRIALVEQYCKLQGLWHDENTVDPEFTDVIELDLGSVEPSLAGPKRPQDRVLLKNAKEEFAKHYLEVAKSNVSLEKSVKVEGQEYKLGNGDVVIAAITSCTNTSNPNVMIAAGLVAKKSSELGLNSQPWVKTSLAPGSQVVSEYLSRSGLQDYLDKLGFNIVGFGCTTCIGNSGPLKPEIEEAITKNNLLAVSVLSGNRNFEGRVHPLCQANYLASPPLVVAYSIVGHMNLDLTKEPIGKDKHGKDVYLKDIWPTEEEINKVISQVITKELFADKYKNVFLGDAEWQKIKVEESKIYCWDADSTYIQNPPYFEGMSRSVGEISNIKNARIIAKFGDSITTDHISPAGNIAKNSPAAKYLLENKVEPAEFNSYGSRRGNHEVMMRGTFANIRIKNELVLGKEGGYTVYYPKKEIMSIYDAAMLYKNDKTPLVIFAGKEYGTGSSRDWAAKGTYLLGIKAVIAESFERIHRSNLVRMGVIPLVFKDAMNRNSINIEGDETIDIIGLSSDMKPRSEVKCIITKDDGTKHEILLESRVDTIDEVEYLKNNGILQTVIRELL